MILLGVEAHGRSYGSSVCAAPEGNDVVRNAVMKCARVILFTQTNIGNVQGMKIKSELNIEN